MGGIKLCNRTHICYTDWMEPHVRFYLRTQATFLLKSEAFKVLLKKVSTLISYQSVVKARTVVNLHQLI